MNQNCPFCGHYPYEMVDVGVGFVPVAVNCCDLGIGLFQYNEKEARQTLEFMQSHSPRKKARAMKVLRRFGLRPEKKTYQPKEQH